MYRKIIISIISIFSVAVCGAADKINVVTTSQDLAYFSEVIGGDKVSVKSLSRGTQDMHYVEPRPSMVLKVKKADMIVRVGMDLDMWIESLIDASRNEHVAIGARGYVDASENVYKLEVPKIKVDPSMGHLHVYGNPHYLIGPQNVPAVLGSILNGLIRVSPENESYFKANKEAYEAEFNQSMEKWKAIMAPLKGRRIVAYHKSWEYFAKCFELNIAGYLEPKPGIPPSPAHLDALIKQMRNEKISLIIQESFYSKKTGEMVARQTGAKLLVLPPAVGAQDMNTYLGLIDHIVNEISSALTR